VPFTPLSYDKDKTTKGYPRKLAHQQSVMLCPFSTSNTIIAKNYWLELPLWKQWMLPSWVV
jgi:hypothetical protein